MGDIERQLRWALICGIVVALMDTDRWHFWGHTDHQGTLIISALMITDYRLSSRAVSVTAREERNSDNRHFPCLHVISCDWPQLIT
ncbi:unnamed protein product [Staurois parvus]|uniref:Uncharacterized protein n=1 Tax=Staurois parvus TaxID=386267 RepID=A0ABN9BLI5_9NEOB|nr:unnamed protein product [Staurois parvus]